MRQKPSAQISAPHIKQEEFSDSPFVSRRVRYGELEHQICVVTKAKGNEKPIGLLTWASGGGFTGGGNPLPPNPEAAIWSYLLIEKGWALAGMGYGLAPEFKYPNAPEAELRSINRLVREDPKAWGFDEVPILVNTGKSAGATSMIRNTVDASHSEVEQPDGQFLFLAITNYLAVDQPFNDIWTRFEPGSPKKDLVEVPQLIDAGAETFVAFNGAGAARMPPPTWLIYSSPGISTEQPYQYLHDAAHGKELVDALEEHFPGQWQEPKYRYTHTPGELPDGEEIHAFLAGAGLARP